MNRFSVILFVSIIAVLLILSGCQPGSKLYKAKEGVVAIALVNKVNPPGTDNKNLCTLDPPCSMHDHTVAEALAAHKPILLQFASPIHCTICDGQLRMVDDLKKKYMDKMVFIHIDGYRDPDSVTQWGHKGDPWCYLIDKKGIIRFVLPGSSIYGELESDIVKTISVE